MSAVTQEQLQAALAGAIQSGSNANGSWIKFADGTMICWRVANVSLDCTLVAGASYVSTDKSWTYPKPFIAIPAVSVSILGTSSGALWVGGGASATSATVAYYRAWAYATTTQSNPVHTIAIGRWK